MFGVMARQIAEKTLKFDHALKAENFGLIMLVLGFFAMAVIVALWYRVCKNG